MSLLATPAPTTADAVPDALERVLGDISVRIRRQRRVVAASDELLAVEASALTVAYVLDGEAHPLSHPRLPDVLAAGDALLSRGRPLALRVPAGSGILLSQLELDDAAAHVSDLLPEAAWVRAFDRLEPAAAALARHLGTDEVAPQRGGDLVICRMMATTLLQSLVRAWSSLGCAPSGWPSPSGDPFLDRVVEAVRADPGRDWTVEQLAAIGAMSRSVFAERFRSAFGRAPAQHVAEVRMRAAQRMLTGGRSVSDVSRALGYGSDEGFSRAFRRHTGLTPSAWRAAGGVSH
ncbi:AraC family transcriptional regulator [Microbacterium sp.]|uniref:AraC family transcriptional regulator n=1 Tax=Microbacterium sp. TaxID=51671 RepID=UPI002811D911|nr:AraC family transcriptional regulator [Microbacterium sp.]